MWLPVTLLQLASFITLNTILTTCILFPKHVPSPDSLTLITESVIGLLLVSLLILVVKRSLND